MMFFAKLLYLLFGNLNLGSLYHRLTSLAQQFLLPMSLTLINIRIFLIIVTLHFFSLFIISLYLHKGLIRLSPASAELQHLSIDNNDRLF
jgi:hypothetical protein